MQTTRQSRLWPDFSINSLGNPSIHKMWFSSSSSGIISDSRAAVCLKLLLVNKFNLLTPNCLFPAEPSRYLSWINSAISFCSCLPFSCFCRRTSKPVTNVVPWGSFLSVWGRGAHHSVTATMSSRTDRPLTPPSCLHLRACGGPGGVVRMSCRCWVTSRAHESVTHTCMSRRACVGVRASVTGGWVCVTCVCVTCVCSFFFFWAHECHTNGRAGMCGARHHLWRQKRNRSVRFMSHSRSEQQVSWQTRQNIATRHDRPQTRSQTAAEEAAGGRGLDFSHLDRLKGFCVQI